MRTGIEIRLKRYSDAWESRYYSWNRAKSKGVVLPIDYRHYCNCNNINRRINNRSWFPDFFDGAMVLSVKYKRRNMPKDKVFNYRPYYCLSKWLEIQRLGFA